MDARRESEIKRPTAAAVGLKPVSSVAGGGLKTGQIIGATDARGEGVVGNPIDMKSVIATLYKVLGIDTAMSMPDFNGRRQYIFDERTPLSALL